MQERYRGAEISAKARTGGIAWTVGRARGLGPCLGSGARTSKKAAQPEYKERHDQSQPDLIRTLKLLGIPAL